MPNYYVSRNAQANGDHEVHKEGCSFLPEAGNRLYLGNFESCRPALIAARLHYSDVDGCYYCCNECHKH